MNIQFNRNGNTIIRMSPNSNKRFGLGRPVLFSDQYLNGVWLGNYDSSFIANYTEEAANLTANDIPGPFDNDGWPTYLYIGFTEIFEAVKVKVGTPTTSTMQWSAMMPEPPYETILNVQSTVQNLQHFQTTTEGVVYWNAPVGWTKTYLRGGAYNEAFAYWIKIDVMSSGNASLITRILKTNRP